MRCAVKSINKARSAFGKVIVFYIQNTFYRYLAISLLVHNGITPMPCALLGGILQRDRTQPTAQQIQSFRPMPPTKVYPKKPISASFSPINQQVRSCHHGRGVGREITRGTHYVRYLTHAAPFDLVRRPFYAVGVGKGGFFQRRAYECRTDRVDADAVTAQFNRHRFCKTFNCMSGTAIDHAINPPDVGHLAGNVDKATRLARRDLTLRHSAGDEIGPLEVQVGHGPFLTFGELPSPTFPACALTHLSAPVLARRPKGGVARGTNIPDRSC